MKEKKVLLLRPRKLGDTVLATLVADAIKRARPSWEIHYLVEKRYAEIFLDHPSIDRVVKMPQGMGPWQTWEFATWLRKEELHLAIDLYSGARTALISFRCCRERYGLRTSWGFLYTKTVPRRISPHTHHIENQFEILKSLGISERPGEYNFPPPQPFSSFEKPYAVVHPFASPLKSLSPEQAEAIGRGLRKMGLEPIFIGFGEEEKRIKTLRSGEKMLGLGLRELRGLIDSAEIFIGVDSGPAHLASTTKTPILVIFGPHNPENYRPWRKFGVKVVETPLPCRPCFEKKCPYSYPRCVQDIPASKILEEARGLLNNPYSYQSG